MPPVAVVCDTTAYLPHELAEAEGIALVSLYVNWGSERTEREADMRNLDSFYDELCSADQLATTSQPSVGDFLSAYEQPLADGRDVVSVHISRGLSGTVEAARQAAERLEREGRGGDRVHVVDSASAAGGLGLLALVAARGAAAGEDVQAVLARLTSARQELKMWFCLDTLEFLKRSGRVGAASAWIGSTLKVKPILTVESEIRPVERVRTSTRAFERMVDYARQRQASGADGWVVQHIQSLGEAERLVERGREVFGSDPLFVSEIGPVLGVHTGPGLLGIGSIPRRFVS